MKGPEMDKLECGLEVLRICAGHDICEIVWWRTDEEYAPITFLVNVNDQFGPCAYAEAITPDNLEIFRQAVLDCAELDKQHPPSSAGIGNGTDDYAIIRADVLFVARLRKTRPWKRKHEKYPPALQPLLLAAAETGYGWA